MKRLIVDGTNLVLGRLASLVAEELLKGESVSIVNAEKVVITGRKKDIMAKWKKRAGLRAKGNPLKGPKFYRMPDRLVRRAVRGMLPFKKARGKQAFKRLHVFIGQPTELKEATPVSLERAENHLKKDFILVGDLSKTMGAKW